MSRETLGCTKERTRKNGKTKQGFKEERRKKGKRMDRLSSGPFPSSCLARDTLRDSSGVHRSTRAPGHIKVSGEMMTESTKKTTPASYRKRTWAVESIKSDNIMELDRWNDIRGKLITRCTSARVQFRKYS